MQHFDLIIIGAGPAGSSAAQAASSAGLKVALIEKQHLPRHKTCGGGMPMSVGLVLRDLVPEACVEATVRYMRHTWNFGDPVLAPIEPAESNSRLSLWMVQRSIFDNVMAQRAVTAGAELRDGLAVKQINCSSRYVQIIAETLESGTKFHATGRHLVGADGAIGITARSIGLRRERMLAIAQEVEQPYRWVGGHTDLRPDVIHLEYGAIRRGYAWVFPKGDHLNVGAGLFRPRRPDGGGHKGLGNELRSAICAYMDYLGVPYDPNNLNYHAHPLAIWNGRQPLQSQDGRVLLCGDAAGLINPIFGDGILNAIRSGIIAANCIARGEADQYTSSLHAEMADNMDAALRLSHVFYRMTGAIYKHGIHRPGATTAAARLLSGEALFSDAARRAMNLMRKSLRSKSSGLGVPSER